MTNHGMLHREGTAQGQQWEAAWAGLESALQHRRGSRGSGSGGPVSSVNNSELCAGGSGWTRMSGDGLELIFYHFRCGPLGW